MESSNDFCSVSIWDHVASDAEGHVGSLETPLFDWEGRKEGVFEGGPTTGTLKTFWVLKRPKRDEIKRGRKI